jgi:condensin complex subunit 1
MFFTELSTKDNAVYNHFVDMFSLLSIDGQLDEEAFRRIVKFLAGFIEKVSTQPSSLSEHKSWQIMSLFARKLTLFDRINMLASSPINSRQGYRDARRRDSGMMSRTHWVYCSIRMKRSRSWLRKVSRLSRHRLELICVYVILA